MSQPNIIVLGNFLKQRPTGVQRFAIELTRAMAEQAPDRVRVLACPNLPIPKRLAHVSVWRGSCFGSLGHRFPAWAFFDAPLFLRLKGIGNSIVWNPSNIGAPHVPRQVLTVHDIGFLHFPEFFSLGFRYKHQLATRATLPRVRGVTTVSHAVKKEIEERFPFLAGKVGVTYNGVSERFVPAAPADVQAVRTKYGIRDRYFLTVGSIDPRKNNKRLVQAYVASDVFARHRTSLVLAGGSFSSFADDPEFAALLRAPGVQHLGYVPDDDLPALYTGCHAFVFPSLYEGFGIPLIEAMACEAPAICSDIPVFREVAGTGVTYFSPRDLESMSARLAEAAANDRAPVDGKAIREKYTWERSAAEMLRLLTGFHADKN